MAKGEQEVTADTVDETIEKLRSLTDEWESDQIPQYASQFVK
jgi:hypothetical protein